MGQTITLTVTADIRNPVGSGLVDFTNLVTVTDDGFNGIDPDLSNNSDRDTDLLAALPDYAVAKTNDLSQPAVPGQTFHYFITVTNNGNQDGTGVRVDDDLPVDVLEATSVTTDDPTNVLYDSATGHLTWLVGPLAGGGGTRTLTVTATVQDPVNTLLASFDNTAVVTDDGANGPDPNLTDNSSTSTVGLDATPEYEIIKRSSLTDAAMPGDDVRVHAGCDEPRQSGRHRCGGDGLSAHRSDRSRVCRDRSTLRSHLRSDDRPSSLGRWATWLVAVDPHN